MAAITSSISKKEFLPLDGIINALIWFGFLSLISLFIFPKSKKLEPQTNKNIHNKEEKENLILDDEPIFSIYQVLFFILIVAVLIIGLIWNQ